MVNNLTKCGGVLLKVSSTNHVVYEREREVDSSLKKVMDLFSSSIPLSKKKNGSPRDVNLSRSRISFTSNVD